jgi:hypothetical protein
MHIIKVEYSCAALMMDSAIVVVAGVWENLLDSVNSHRTSRPTTTLLSTFDHVIETNLIVIGIGP